MKRISPLFVGSLLLTLSLFAQNRTGLQADSWRVRKTSFLEFAKQNDPNSNATRNAVFNLLTREHRQLNTWIKSDTPPPEAWSEEHYPNILEYIQTHYMGNLQGHEFQHLARASMNPESNFATSLSKHAGSSLAWLNAAVKTEENENIRVNMIALAANWLLSANRPTKAQNSLVQQILQRGSNDKSTLVAAYSKRALARLATRISP